MCRLGAAMLCRRTNLFAHIHGAGWLFGGNKLEAGLLGLVVPGRSGVQSLRSLPRSLRSLLQGAENAGGEETSAAREGRRRRPRLP